MLFRDEISGEGADSTLFIPQPAHALLSGGIAAAWGAAGFARPDPADAVILAAAQHDLAWMPWEAEPTLDASTGRPHEFRAVGARVHAPMWARGVELALASWGLWPALLISRHGSLIYTRYGDRHRPDSADGEAAARYLEEHAGLRARWAAALRASKARVEANGAIVAVADALSLALCFGGADALGGHAGDAPLEEGGAVPLSLSGAPGAGWRLDPWPFVGTSLTLACEVMRFPRDARWTDEAAMRRDLRDAPRVRMAETLRPA